LVEKATAAGHWKSGNFNFKHAFSAEFDGLSITETQKPEHRQTEGEKLMTNMSKDGKCSIYVNAPFAFSLRGEGWTTHQRYTIGQCCIAHIHRLYLYNTILIPNQHIQVHSFE
jgi:hypothetical protein